MAISNYWIATVRIWLYANDPAPPNVLSDFQPADCDSQLITPDRWKDKLEFAANSKCTVFGFVIEEDGMVFLSYRFDFPRKLSAGDRVTLTPWNFLPAEYKT